MFRWLFVLALLLAPVASIAQPLQGLYIGGSIGPNFASSLESSQNNTKISTDIGPVGLATLGWRFPNGLRVEIEGSYRSNSVNDIKTLRLNGSFEPLSNVSGTQATYAAMANVAYDIPYRPFGVQPYIGAGVGYGWLDFGGTHGDGVGLFLLPGDNRVQSTTRASFGSAGAVAYQAMLGASLPITRHLDATLEYRFFGTGNAEIPVNRVGTQGEIVNGHALSASTHNGFSVLDNAVLLGVRYRFGG